MNISSLAITRLIVILSLCCITFRDSVRTIQENLKKTAKNDSLSITHIFQSKNLENYMDAVAEVLPIGTKFPKNNIKIA